LCERAHRTGKRALPIVEDMTTRDRDEVFLELTRSICPVCKTTVDAEVNARDDQVFLRKRCREHGEFEARVYGDARMYLDISGSTSPAGDPSGPRPKSRTVVPPTAGSAPSISSTPVSG
jgi:uncharacterized radical SAM superfamily Fe-S cluster-containing enzyme